MSDRSTSVLHRHPKTRNFTQVENDLIRDPRLSHRATGLIIYLLSLPDGSRIDSTSLTPRKREGRDAIRAAYTELVAAGYVTREKRQDTDSGKWSTVIHVFEVPKTDSQASGNQSSGNRASVSQALSLSENKTGKQERNRVVCTGCGDVFATTDALCSHIEDGDCPALDDDFIPVAELTVIDGDAA